MSNNINDLSNNPLNYSYNRNKIVLERCRDKINLYSKNHQMEHNIVFL